MILYPRDNPRLAAFQACTPTTCPISASYFSSYRPSLATNVVFLALFSLSLCGFLLQSALPRQFVGFTVAMISGCILEISGYVGRVMSYHNPFNQDAFLLQTICLTIAPAFLALGIYLLLPHLIQTLGPQTSRLAPPSYLRLFIPCAVLSLLLQAGGGIIASTASHQTKSPATGSHIMLAGLAVQVLTLLAFQLLCLDVTIRIARRTRALGADAALLEGDQRHAARCASARFGFFIVALALATVCICVRSVYRVVELSKGWDGALSGDERLFVGFEGAMVGVAVLVLNLAHPGYCFHEGDAQLGYRDLFRPKGNGKGGVDAVMVGGEKGAPERWSPMLRQDSSGCTSRGEGLDPLNGIEFPDFVQRGRMEDQAYVMGPKGPRVGISEKEQEDGPFITWNRRLNATTL